MSNLFQLPAAPNKFDERKKKSRSAILELAQLTGLGDLTSLLVELGGGFNLTADDRKFLAGPIIVHQSAWMADIPDWMFRQIRVERTEIILGEKSPYIVGPTEIAAVMFPRSMEAPMGHELTDLYLWASSLACSRQYKRDLAGIWKSLNQSPISDKEVIQRGGRLWEPYSSLASEIRRKVIAHAPKLKRTKADQDAPPPKSPRPVIQGEQLSLLAA